MPAGRSARGQDVHHFQLSEERDDVGLALLSQSKVGGVGHWLAKGGVELRPGGADEGLHPLVPVEGGHSVGTLTYTTPSTRRAGIPRARSSATERRACSVQSPRICRSTSVARSAEAPYSFFMWVPTQATTLRAAA